MNLLVTSCPIFLFPPQPNFYSDPQYNLKVVLHKGSTRSYRVMNANQGYQRPAAAANYPRGISPVIPGDALLLDICDDVELLYDVIDELNMDGILQQVLSFPPNPPPTVLLSDKDYDKQVRAVVQVLNATSGKKLTGGVSTGEDLLDVRRPQH